MQRKLSSLTAAACLAVAVNAHATDGVIEINAAKVAAGGGYPFVITQPGSYRLTSNLSIADPNTNVITIGAPNVAIDMNGFTIGGPVSCIESFFAPVVCSGGATGAGIGYDSMATPPVGNIKVRNGNIVGMGWGLMLPDGDIDNVTARNSRYIGINLKGGSVRNSNALANGSRGIQIGGGGTSGGIIQSCRSLRNGSDGVFLLDGGVVADSQIQWNGTDGVVVNAQAVVSRNNISNNADVGIRSTPAPASGGSISHNTVYGNGSIGIDVSSGSVIGNLVHWNAGVGLNANYAVSMKDNNFQGNNSGGIQTSGSVLYNGGGNMCGPAACP